MHSTDPCNIEPNPLMFWTTGRPNFQLDNTVAGCYQENERWVLFGIRIIPEIKVTSIAICAYKFDLSILKKEIN